MWDGVCVDEGYNRCFWVGGGGSAEPGWSCTWIRKKNSFSSESSLSSSRVLKDRGRYPYRMAFLMTARSHLRYPHLQEGCLQGLWDQWGLGRNAVGEEHVLNNKNKQDAQLSQRDRAARCVKVFCQK